MTVVWTVKVANEWFDECVEKGFDDCFEETFRRFGPWIHSVSYASCFELRDRVEEYLEMRGVSTTEYLKVIGFFCIALEEEISYDKHLYELLREALKNVAETSKEEIIKLHAESLIKLIMTAEKLKSGITCTG